MFYGDIEGKGKIYSITGDLIKLPGEKVKQVLDGALFRGWVRYKLGWRTIMFRGSGRFHITNGRIVYLERPEYIEKIHTLNIDHEIGDFGGWDYHAHRMRRAVQLGALIFFELPLKEITEIKHKKEGSFIFVKDEKNKYKMVVDGKTGGEISRVWNR